ncbi:MAG: ATP-binding protein [Bdellovibrionota bacterium]
MLNRILKRELLDVVQHAFNNKPVITITGPRQSGKTTLCKEAFPNLPYVNFELPFEREAAEHDPLGFLKKYPSGVIIDEIQKLPELVSYIQAEVDKRGGNSHFVLTGSEQFKISNTLSQSLAGRTSIFKLLPFSLKELCLNLDLSSASIEYFIYRGFYPRIYHEEISPTNSLADYFETYIERDLRSLSQIGDLSLFRRFVRACAARIGQVTDFNNIGNEVGVSHTTSRRWLSILEASFIVYLLEPYSRNVSKRIIKSPKIYFYDVGLATFLLGIHEASQIEAHPLRGLLFENLIISEVLKNRYNNGLHSNLYYLRDSSKTEVDLILDYGTELESIEIKSSKTPNKDFTKGFGMLENAVKTKIKNRLVIYDGDDEYDGYGAKFFPYKKYLIE